jgi:hypothetical protein
MSMEEKLPYYVESICKALSINNEQELNQLMALFDKNNLTSEKDDMNYILDQSIEDSRGDIERFDPERGSKLEIDPDNLLRLLREFYEDKKKKTREQSNFIL